MGVGLLLGSERERRRGARGPGTPSAAGIRTFALLALLGGLTQLFSSWAVFTVAAAFVVGAALLSYRQTAPSDPGLTTEVAMLVAFLLGAIALREPILAAGIGTAVTLLLAARSRLHRWVRESLTEREFHDALLFLGAALVVLPLAPDRDFGPAGFELFNPFTVWRLVVLVMFVQALGYVALRVVGPRHGLPLAGFLGGFVSSTLTIAALARRAGEARGDVADPRFAGAVAGALLSTVTTVLFVAAVIATTSLELLAAMARPLVLAGAASIAWAAIFWWRGRGRGAGAPADGTALAGFERRAFDLKSAVALAAVVSLVLAVARLLHGRFGSNGLAAALGIAGFADSQSAAISAATVVASGEIGAPEAARAVALAFSTNTVSKLIAAWAAGERRYAIIVSFGLLVVLAALWAGSPELIAR